MSAAGWFTFSGVCLLVVLVLQFGTVANVERARAALARWRARRACLDQIEGCTRTDRHYHPGSGVAP